MDEIEINCLKKYLIEGDELLYCKTFISHDGYDDEGPKSNLYNFKVFIKRKNKILYDIFHREDWFRKGERGEEYFPLKFSIQPYDENDYAFEKSLNELIKNNIKEEQQFILKCFITNDFENKKFKYFIKNL